MKKFLQEIGFNKLPAWARFVAVIVTIALLWKMFGAKIKQWLSLNKTKQDLTDYHNSEHQAPIYDNSDNNGTPPPNNAIIINTYQVAQQVYDCFYNNDWFGWTEDEDGAIAAISSVPKSYVPEVAVKYAQIQGKGKNLYSDFVKYLSTSKYNSIKNHLT